jgi:sporulation-control protein spo0M
VEDLDEIELVFDPGPDSRTVLAEVDRDEAQRRLQNAIQRHV